MRDKKIEKIFFFCFLILSLALWHLQVIKGPFYSQLSQTNRIKIRYLPAPRGKILDSHYRVMAYDKACFNLAVIPQEIKNRKLLFARLAEIFRVPEQDLENNFKRGLSSPFSPIVLFKNIPKEKAFMIEESKSDFPGVAIQPDFIRLYPYRKVASHLLGYLGLINPPEWERLKPYGYERQTYLGKTGVEKFFDVYLRGKPGGLQLEVDNRANLVRLLGEKLPQKGKDLTLTINIKWQEVAHELLKGKRGAIIVMDVNDGKLLVLESSPSFDPNIFIQGKDSQLRYLLSSPGSPLLNRAVCANFPPGSIFKLITAIAGLERKKIKPYQTFSCNGKFFLGREKFNCWNPEGHGNLKITEAIKYSCNIFFYKLGLKVGEEDLRKFGRLFGFGEKTSLELPYEGKGLIPGRKWKLLKKRERWFKGDTVNYSIGQGYILVSPLQIARFIAAVANGGYLLRPYLVSYIGDAKVSEAKKEFVGVSSQTLSYIKKGMVKVVNDPQGTGARVRVPGLKIAAKTATAEVAKGLPHAWIAGFLPFDAPRLSFVVFLEHGGRGGVEAADLACALLRELKEEIITYTRNKINK